MSDKVFRERTPEEFKIRASSLGIKEWKIRECSICSYPLKFIFSRNGDVHFESRCDCDTTLRENPSLRKEEFPPVSSWKVVAESYNLARNHSIIKEWAEFWYFND